ncbi:MAG TPA: alpha/beta hydrolase, partial [Tepidiformaceae bacterium]|nr:alpha/beta hydrolase [Tepidiformaceae bacterium]
MLPRIQYAQAEDNVSIAFWTVGDGVPVALLYPPGFSNIQYEWEMPEARAFFDELSSWATVIRFDHRNNGLSERGLTNITPEDFGRDLLGVLDRLDVPRAHLFAVTESGKIAIQFAAEHPDRVASVTLFGANPGAGPAGVVPGWKSLAPIMRTDWPLFTDLLATAVNGLADGAQAGRISHYLRESVTAQEFESAHAALGPLDVRCQLTAIKCPV